MIDVAVKDTQPMTVAFLAMRGAYEQIPQALGQLYCYVGANGMTPTGMPHAVYYTAPGEGHESEARWEVRAPVADTAQEREADAKGLGVKRVAPMKVASTLYKGPYEGIEPTYRELGEWVATEGYQITGPPMEFYQSDPAQVPPEEYLTEIQFPIAKV